MPNELEMIHRTFLLLLFCILAFTIAAPYYGTKIGKFNTHFHDVTGDVYAVDDKRIFVKGFTYDGAGPDAFFWAGKTSRPDATGFIIPDEKGGTKPLKAYRNKDLLLKLPEGKTLKDIKWLAVWCRKFHANFADLLIPRNLQIPRPTNIGKMSSLQHGVSSGKVMVLDSQTFLVPDFTYDGQGPAAYWWVSKGAGQNERGLRLKDENGSPAPLAQYTGKTVVISLPDIKTIYDYDWLGVWCQEFNVDFGSVKIPHHIAVPPSLSSLGVKTENKLNCEVLLDDLGFELRWVVEENDVIMQLVAKIDKGEYMAFGFSKNDTFTRMVDADAIITWIDGANRGHAVDYYLESKQQCVGNRGVCPDTKYSSAQENVLLMNAAIVNGYTMITFRRPQLGVDAKYDQHIYSDGPQAVMWAIGQINNRGEASYHKHKTKGNYLIDFFRPPLWNCPEPGDYSSEHKETSPVITTTTTTTEEPKTDAWDIQPIVCPADQTFRVQIGPTGGKRGYQAITGNVGWGIAWYVNGILVPELTVERGKTYTFLVEGGYDAQNPSRHHPLYITDDPEGGYEYKSEANKRKVTIFAGVGINRSGKVVPTATGRLCEWKIPTNRTVKPDDYETFENFQRQLTLKCENGKAGVMSWKPDRNTPDLVYYQCFTHRFLGWKIHVVDSCKENRILQPSASGRTTNNIYYKTDNHLLKTTTAAPVDYEIIYYDYVDELDNKTSTEIYPDIIKVKNHHYHPTSLATKWPAAVFTPERVTTRPTRRPTYRFTTTTITTTTTTTTQRPRKQTVINNYQSYPYRGTTRRPFSKPSNVYQEGFVPLIIRTNRTLEDLFQGKPRREPISRHDTVSSSNQPKFGERIRKPGSVPLLVHNANNLKHKNNFLSSVLPTDIRFSTLIPDDKHPKPSKGPLLPMLVPLPQENLKNTRINHRHKRNLNL
ncbi:protein Skeletor, isoforms B/C-like [Centruroides vittatus]|uniref:protein Skeletor, isoforms B/C-like n=1 Tax=Centruroides vittatus TaxID=120091 RepID=UPI00350F1577